MLKVYFTASTSFNGQFKEYYKKIIKEIKNYNCQLASGNQIVNDNLLKKDKLLSEKEIFQREKQKIELSDCIIAEVTKPSHGVGGQIVYGLIKNKPVLGLVIESNKDLISPMIKGNPSENFFFERYSLNNLKYKIRNFLDYVYSLKNRRGKLIVIDGGNGSGKTTQTKTLVDYLIKNKKNCRYYDFPQYYTSFHGETVAKFLRGDFGEIDKVSPYLSSLAFALDRATVKNEMEDFLNKGGYIISNRYVTSSMAHQGAKFNDLKEREEFLKWLFNLEYKVHKMPKEDLVIYLYVPWQIGMKLSEKKSFSQKYLKGKQDIEEKDIRNRIESEKLYLEFSKKYRHWVKIDCVINNNILPPKIIHQKIIEVLKKKKMI